MNARKTALRLAMVIGVAGILAATADRALADRPDFDRGHSYERHDGGHDRDGFGSRDGRWDRDGYRDRNDWRRPVVVPYNSYGRTFAPAPVYAPPIGYVRTGIPCGNGLNFSVQTGRTVIRISIGG